ncbi:MAG TPA: ornithine cyclodeaminase family protein, partial [Thermoleophilia bacterium]|nr:ornithine cyclodeaminase family protein [Thermoleophilia bacterium]
MTLILTSKELRQLLTLDDVLRALSEAHVAFSKGDAVQPVRMQMPVAKHNGRLLIMPSYLPSNEALTVKILAGFHDNTLRGLPPAYAVIIVLDPETGNILALMDGGYITGLRTAGASVLASRHLANPDSGVLAIIGGGYIGRMCGRTFAEDRDLEQILVFSRTPATAQAFKDELDAELDVPISIAATAEEACRSADIIVTATAAEQPVLRYAWLKPGAHINAVGSSLPHAREVDTECVKRALLVVESRAATLAEAGDIVIPLRQGEIDNDVIHAELGEVIAATKLGRTDPNQITLFKSGGIAVQDTATASLAYQKARQLGMGMEVE